MQIARRTFAAGGLAMLAAPALAQQAVERVWIDQLAAIETSLGGRVGVSALHLDTGMTIAQRAHERFALCSTFKAPLAAAILQQVQYGEDDLDAVVPFSERDLLSHAPAARARVAEGGLSVRDLCAAAVVESDNTAANLLLARLGGPQGFTAWLRRIGDRTTRLDRNEPSLNTNIAGDRRDTTTPRAMCDTLNRLLFTSEILAPASQALLGGWMRQSHTGARRLRYGLPLGWNVGDKTGTGPNGAVNDIAAVFRGTRGRIVIACYIHAPDATLEAAEAAHADVAQAVSYAFGHAIALAP